MRNKLILCLALVLSGKKFGRPAAKYPFLASRPLPETIQANDVRRYVDMMDCGCVQLLAPVLPPMARARTAYVVPGTRFTSTIRRACEDRMASPHVLPASTLVCT